MCPACLASAALVVTGTSGGLAALAIKRVFCGADSKTSSRHADGGSDGTSSGRDTN